MEQQIVVAPAPTVDTKTVPAPALSLFSQCCLVQNPKGFKRNKR